MCPTIARNTRYWSPPTPDRRRSFGVQGRFGEVGAEHLRLLLGPFGEHELSPVEGHLLRRPRPEPHINRGDVSVRHHQTPPLPRRPAGSGREPSRGCSSTTPPAH